MATAAELRRAAELIRTAVNLGGSDEQAAVLSIAQGLLIDDPFPPPANTKDFARVQDGPDRCVYVGLGLLEGFELRPSRGRWKAYKFGKPWAVPADWPKTFPSVLEGTEWFLNAWP